MSVDYLEFKNHNKKKTAGGNADLEDILEMS